MSVQAIILPSGNFENGVITVARETARNGKQN
jgi:hypothetical protein